MAGASPIVVCQGSIDGREPGTRKGCHYISMHHIKLDKAIGVNLRLMADRSCEGDREGTPTSVWQAGPALSC